MFHVQIMVVKKNTSCRQELEVTHHFCPDRSQRNRTAPWPQEGENVLN